MMQEQLGLHPILLFLGLLVGVQIAGLWGALFGVPILAVIVILVNHWLDIYSPEDAAIADRGGGRRTGRSANEEAATAAAAEGTD